MPSAVRATRDVVSTAARALDAAALRTALIGPLQRLMQVGPVFIASADPTTWLFTGGSNALVGVEASKRFLANEYGGADVVKFADLARAKRPVNSMFVATDGAPETSARWRDVIEPLGWGDELRVALRDRSGVWGFLCLHRTADQPAFDAKDVATVQSVIPTLTKAFRRTTAVAAIARDPADGPGVILLRPDLVVEAVTGSAANLLDELRESDPDYHLPMPVAALASRLINEDAPQRLTMRTPSGRWVSLHAGFLDSAGGLRVVVVVEPPSPMTVLPVFALAIGLTPRETEVTAALLRGDSNRLAARSLEVSELTVETQIRSVFAKAGVHSRGELVGRLMSGG
jgi:DNA-binding CsgD family transcriptional regulator